MLVAATKRQEREMNQMGQGSVDVANVSVIDGAMSDRPGDILKNSLVTAKDRERGASRRDRDPEERRQGQDQRRD